MTGEYGPDDLYAPNQQVVRGDASGPAEEGAGGVGPVEATADDPLDAMTKAQLLDEAAARGVDVDDSMTKAEIRAAIGG